MFRTNVNSLIRLGVAVIIVIFGSMTQVANADQFVEDFETPLDFLADGVGTSGWDGFLGLGADETANALNASVTRAGELYMESADGRWEGATPMGPYLYKIVEGDFIASVHVADYQDVLHNSANLMARNVNDEDAGDGDDWVSIDYFPIWSCGNFVRDCDDGGRTERGHNGKQFDLDPYMQLERVGNTFHFRTSVDGVTWTEMDQSPLVRDDFDGLPMQVGLAQATFSGDSGYAVFDDFILEGENVEPKSGKGSSKPSPDNGATDVLRDSTLSWKPGEYAVTHNLYVGESLEDVNAATEATASGLDVNSFDPGRLEFGETVFWRVDEVNGTPDKTVFTGDVWSFTVEPYSIQIPGSEIIPTASSSSNDLSMPEKTLDGSGLSEDGTHSFQTETMWFTAMGDMDPWIQYEFDGVKKLDIMKVWNSNSSAEGFIGYGAKEVQIEYSKDGETWDTLEDANEFSRATGLPTYDQPDSIDFGGAAAKMVRIKILSNFGGFMQSYSISEVQFSMIPAAARTPEPASGAVDILPNAVVSWRAGREAAQSIIYASTDANKVMDGSAASVTSTTNSINLSALDVQVGQTYYWRVDEVNEAEVTSVWASPVWSFSTVEAMVVDDFESYGNDSPDRPFQTWLDGIGYSADEFFSVGYGGNGTGAAVGHDIWSGGSVHYNGDIMETGNVDSGKQALPLGFNGASEIQRTFAPAQDWTLGGITTLSIAVRGNMSLSNSNPLYLKINNTKVMYEGDLSVPKWRPWHVDLIELGINLTSITTLSFGVEGSGSGMIYLDSIALYKTAPPVPEYGVIFSDDFETAHDYVADGVDGTGWDGFVGLNPGETVDALNASIDRAGQLYLASTNAVWSDPWDTLGPFLYKIIEGNFIATVKVVDYAGTPGAEVFHNDGSLSARVPNPADAGDGEDWVSIDYFPIWNCGNFVRTADDNSRNENGNNGMAFGLDPWLQLERVGNTFHFRTSVDGLSWTEMDVSPITRDDMAGLPLQVGIRHATYSDEAGYIAFDNFSIER